MQLPNHVTSAEDESDENEIGALVEPEEKGRDDVCLLRLHGATWTWFCVYDRDLGHDVRPRCMYCRGAVIDVTAPFFVTAESSDDSV